MSVGNRIARLEQRPQPRHPHGMTSEQFADHLRLIEPRRIPAFVATLTDSDLMAGIEHFKEITEQHHAST